MAKCTLAELKKLAALAKRGNVQARDFLDKDGSRNGGLKLLIEAGDQEASRKLEHMRAVERERKRRKDSIKKTGTERLRDSMDDLSRRSSSSQVSSTRSNIGLQGSCQKAIGQPHGSHPACESSSDDSEVLMTPKREFDTGGESTLR